MVDKEAMKAVEDMEDTEDEVKDMDEDRSCATTVINQAIWLGSVKIPLQRADIVMLQIMS